MEDKKIKDIIINNPIIPIKKRNIEKGHKIIYLSIAIVIILQILFIDIKGETEDLFKTAKEKMKNVNYTLTKSNFDKRGNNLWINLLYYKQYIEKIDRYFKGSQIQINKPKYPLLSFIIKPVTGYHTLTPSNFVEIASFLRQNLGSGVTIREQNKLVGEKIINTTKRNELFKIVRLYKKYIQQRFKLVIQAKKKNKQIIKTYPISYGNIPNFYPDIKKLFLTKTKLYKISIYNNEESLLFFQSEKEKILGSQKAIYSENIYKRKENEVTNILRNIENKLARIYTIEFYGQKQNEDFIKEITVRFDNFPSIENIIKDLFQENNNNEITINKITLRESKILKHRANSRELIDFREIPPYIRKAFALIEDDNFYIQAGGIDPFGLTKATFNYFFEKTKKGNASIIEQVYEMYLGKRKKTPFDKAIQILGAIYLNYYEKNRDPFINLYVQSIPGSFFRDHNYGIKAIIKNYLNKNLISELSIKEIAWLTRIALLPNTFGQDYIRFHILKEELAKYKVNILNDTDVKKFIKNTKKQRKQNKKKNKDIENTLSIINRLRNAYKLTNLRINKALSEFKKGNEFISPLITETEYKEAKNDKIRFMPSSIINEYQSYTDQTLKEINKYIGKWARNSGLDVEVSFYEKEQQILEKELSQSTQTAYNYRYDLEAEHKSYGGASVLIKTHNIKSGKIENKIVAIASRHTNPEIYFNWAVDGHRHFGSIFKWIVLLLYLDKHGTLLDTFYDIPRSFEYTIGKKNGKTIKGIYRPDNWRIDREYNYGHFTYKQHHNIYNFLQSKNNTFVKLADIVGLETISNFLNKIAELENNPNENLKFDPIYPIVLGSQDINSIRFAQINTVIANKGILQPITTINRIIQNDNSSLTINLEKEKKQVVSREAAEGSLFCGYLNTYFGTAKAFIKGGAGKTGSSDTDVSFIATTMRTEKEYIEEKEDSLLNYNLLYLVNVGVNEGKIDDGLFGGNVAALNSKEVFEQILGRYYTGKETKLQYPIAGNFTEYFSKKLYYKPIPGYKKINNNPIQAPLIDGKIIAKEDEIDEYELMAIKEDYESHKDVELEEQTAIDFAEADGKEFDKLSREKQQEYRNLAAIEVEKQRFEYQFKQYEKQLSQVYETELDIKDKFAQEEMKQDKKEEGTQENKDIASDNKEKNIKQILESTKPKRNENESEEDFLKTLIGETLKEKETETKKEIRKETKKETIKDPPKEIEEDKEKDAQEEIINEIQKTNVQKNSTKK